MGNATDDEKRRTITTLLDDLRTIQLQLEAQIENIKNGPKLSQREIDAVKKEQAALGNKIHAIEKRLREVAKSKRGIETVACGRDKSRGHKGYSKRRMDTQHPQRPPGKR